MRRHRRELRENLGPLQLLGGPANSGRHPSMGGNRVNAGRIFAVKLLLKLVIHEIPLNVCIPLHTKMFRIDPTSGRLPPPWHDAPIESQRRVDR